VPDQTAEVLAADERRFEAMRKQDWVALDAALADDLTYVHSTARLESKAEHIGNLKAGKPYYRGIAPRDRKARVHGDVGIVNGVSEMHVENAGPRRGVCCARPACPTASRSRTAASPSRTSRSRSGSSTSGARLA
jgi:hypothetical protein